MVHVSEKKKYKDFMVLWKWLRVIVIAIDNICHDAVNEGMSRRAIHKALYESAALIGTSVLQVYLMRRLFERKIGLSRV